MPEPTTTKPAITAPSGAAGLAGLSPAYFGLVMATGIVSVAADMHGWPGAARLLFGLNIGFYAMLWLLYILRLWRHPRAVLADFCDHARASGFFTSIAATAVLGTQALLLGHSPTTAIALGALAILLWLLLTYPIYAVLTVRADKPPLARGLNGGWLLAVVATQSLAVLGALLTDSFRPAWRAELDFFALSMWLWGSMLYIWMIALIFYRYLFFPLPPDDLTPPYWINMGAMAISALAGGVMIENAADSPLLQSMLPFIKGMTILYWATGSWWIPMLLLLGAWRYLFRRFPFSYSPLYWGAVFPLGMYAACTDQIARAMDLPFLNPLSNVFLLVAFMAWAMTMAGLLLQLARR